MAESPFEVIQEQLREAIRAPKCHPCGRLQKTVEALASTEAGRGELSRILDEAKSVFAPNEYDSHLAITGNVLNDSWNPITPARRACPFLGR